MKVVEDAGRALNDVRVVEFGEGVAGAFASRILGDLGADVIKVESPGGDRMRREPPLTADGEARSGVFEYLNWNKRSVVLDLAEEEDAREQAFALATGAAVVIDATGPHVLDGYGLGQSRLRDANRVLTVVSITPFGQDGP